MVRRSNPCGGEFFRNLSTPGLGPTQPPIRVGNGSFPGINWSGCDIHSNYLAPKLKKEKSYTSASPVGFYVLFYGEIYLYVYLCLSLASNSNIITALTEKPAAGLVLYPIIIQSENPTCFDVSF